MDGGLQLGGGDAGEADHGAGFVDRDLAGVRERLVHPREGQERPAAVGDGDVEAAIDRLGVREGGLKGEPGTRIRQVGEGQARVRKSFSIVAWSSAVICSPSVMH